MRPLPSPSASYDDRARHVAHTPVGKIADKPSQIRKIAFLGDYLSRQCGIVAFLLDHHLILPYAIVRPRHYVRRVIAR